MFDVGIYECRNHQNNGGWRESLYAWWSSHPSIFSSQSIIYFTWQVISVIIDPTLHSFISHSLTCTGNLSIYYCCFLPILFIHQKHHTSRCQAVQRTRQLPRTIEIDWLRDHQRVTARSTGGKLHRYRQLHVPKSYQRRRLQLWW